MTQLIDQIPKIDGFYYLACPYGHPDKNVTNERMTEYEKVDAYLSAGGHLIMSPLDKHYKLKHGNMPGDYGFWRTYCMAMLKLASGIIVIMLDGWETSPGVQDEIKTAMAMGLPVYSVYEVK